MRIFAYDRFKPGVTLETIEPYLPEEVANVWRLWKAGIVRENYARADEPGVVIVFELDSVEDARRFTDDFPLTKAGFLEWFFIPLMAPLPIESLFRRDVDVAEPYDRTTAAASNRDGTLEGGVMQRHRNLQIPDTLAEACDPDRMALVVYDMQVGVVGQLADGPQVTERVMRVLDAARRAGVRVFFTRHMTLPTELMGISQLRMWMAWQHKTRVEEIVSPFLRDSPGFHIVPELAPRESEAVFDKLSLSAFEGTPLEFALRDSQMTAFAIVGVALEVGMEPTVRHGADQGLIPVVVTDACGAGNRAAAQRSLDTLAFAGDAILTDSSTITGLLETARAPQEIPR